MIHRIADYLRKRKIDAEIERIQKNTQAILNWGKLTKAEADLLAKAADDQIYRLQLQKELKF